MSLLDLDSEAQKNDLIYLIRKVKAYKAEIGAYIEHFHYNDNVIIIKLTNGFIKVNETILLKHQHSSEILTDKELIKIGGTFVQTLL
ncbi:MAG: hypothetical protein ABIP95_14880 [Pelobium sp.]